MEWSMKAGHPEVAEHKHVVSLGRPAVGEPQDCFAPHPETASAVREFCAQREWDIGESMLTVNQNETLGKGAWGVVKRGELRNGSQRLRVAVKMWPEADRGLAQRLFEQEARVLQRVAGVNHCCQLLGGCLLGDRKCLVMKLYKSTLQDALLARPGGALELQSGIRSSLEILSGLQALHDARIVYMDLKPSNILFDEYGAIFLADFGISRILPPGQERFAPESVDGTPNFMSPEQFRPVQSGGVSIASDVWSAGCVVLEVMSGHTPFRGMQHGDIEAEVCDRRSGPHIPPHLTHGLSDILGTCFRHDPSQRPAAGSLRRALQAFQVKLPSAPTTMEAPQTIAPPSPISVLPFSKTGPFITASADSSPSREGAAPSRPNKPPPPPPPQEAILIDI
eukprot:CAMPEP_0114108246 /NCGR_PEP_ID=MMETSP0043_2-20121206/117_1 /TAXON_ID=464988 /ORGANISM="Hemiselmis andersenii, Strain CCMP644" /LENGTH=393 /DNA_ID=CAMNT_0001199997 /DNA_START=1 /DNA_END=1183 /DNA_ORIENTATION=-